MKSSTKRAEDTSRDDSSLSDTEAPGDEKKEVILNEAQRMLKTSGVEKVLVRSVQVGPREGRSEQPQTKLQLTF